ncbi:hypothetical protein QUF74_19125 [Candidatus Halobeggiatoa sp. HSG11]|nr:hypothetical protein [Candidatus Halobeggiatoa sp. HSG11]
MKFYNKFFLFFMLLAMAFSVQAKRDIYYCWLNDDEVRECGNYIPALPSQKGFWKCKRGSSECEYVNPAPTAEELAEIELKKEKERKLKEQEESDEALLALFSRERDIENRRTALLSSIGGQIQPIQTILEGLKGNLEDLKESYERSKNNQDVSQSQVNAIRRNIDSVKKRIIDTEDTLQNKLDEQIEINMEYDTYLQRFLEIQLRRFKREPSISTSKLAIYQEKIDEVILRITTTLQGYIEVLQERKNSPSLSDAQKITIQEKIDKISQRFQEATPQ